MTSTDPTGGSDAWTVANADGNNSLKAVSCASTALCVAVDAVGNAVTATSPTGGASAWTVTNVDATGSLDGVSCPVVGLCVAVDDSGYVVVGTSPPSTTTGSAGLIGQTSATLSGSVNPNGLSVTDCHFSYGIGSPSGTNVPCAALPGSGTSDLAVSALLSGLTAGATYQFRLVATSTGGVSNGAIGTFTTVAPPVKHCLVPKLKGKTLKTAKHLIKTHGCTTRQIRRAASRKVKKGHVISQKPKPGKRLKRGAKINLVVSRGKH